MSSESDKDMDVPSPLSVRKGRTTSTMTKASRVKKEKVSHSAPQERRDSGFEDIIIDHHPLLLGDSLTIHLQPQDIVLEFSVTQVDEICTFTLDNMVHLGRYKSYLALRADQVLIPLLCFSGIGEEHAIVHYTREIDFHLRIARTQLHRVWHIIEGRLNVWGPHFTNESWKIQISDHNFWSTKPN
jgi:hypothetical protein